MSTSSSSSLRLDPPSEEEEKTSFRQEVKEQIQPNEKGSHPHRSSPTLELGSSPGEQEPMVIEPSTPTVASYALTSSTSTTMQFISHPLHESHNSLKHAVELMEPTLESLHHTTEKIAEHSWTHGFKHGFDGIDPISLVSGASKTFVRGCAHLFIEMHKDDFSQQKIVEVLKDDSRALHEKLDTFMQAPLYASFDHLASAINYLRQGSRDEALRKLESTQESAILAYHHLKATPHLQLQCMKVRLIAEYLKEGPTPRFWTEATTIINTLCQLPLLRSALMTQAFGDSPFEWSSTRAARHSLLHQFVEIADYLEQPGGPGTTEYGGVSNFSWFESNRYYFVHFHRSFSEVPRFERGPIDDACTRYIYYSNFETLQIMSMAARLTTAFRPGPVQVSSLKGVDADSDPSMEEISFLWNIATTGTPIKPAS